MLMGRAPNESVYKWLARTDEESKKAVESLIELNAAKHGFKEIVRTNKGPFLGVECDRLEKVDGEWAVVPVEKSELYVGDDMARLSRTYRILPDVACSIIETGVMHEDTHYECDTPQRIKKEEIENGIRKYGKDRFESLNENEREAFIQFDILGGYADEQAIESRVNDALYRRLLDSGADREHAIEKIATVVWYIGTYQMDDTINGREGKLLECVNETLNERFAHLEQKDEVMRKTMEIEKAYQKGLRKLDYISNPKYRKGFATAHK